MLVRAYLRAYGLVFVVFAVIVYWAFLDREHQRDIVLADTAVIATQQSQLISKGVTFFHVAARYLLGEVVSSVEDEHLSQLQSDEELRQFYNSLLQNKLLDAPFLHGLSIIGSDCSTLAANDALHRSFTQTPARCDQLWQTSSPVLQMHVLGPGQTVHAGGLVAFSRQITSQSGEFLGAVTTGLDLDFVKDWFGHYASRNNESITLLGPDGQVLAHMTYGLSEIRAHEVFLIMRASAHDTGVENSQDARNAQYAQSDRNASGNSVYGSAGAAMRTLSGSQSYLGEEAVYALSRVDGLPMYVLVSYDIQRQLANWREHSVKTGLFVFGLFLLSLLIVQSYLRVLQQREALAELATTDALTGMSNRRHLMEVGTYEVRRANRYERPLSMLLVDADHFKDINDEWGHGAGDLVLKRLGHTILSNLRQTDLGARIGGEEFVVLLPETPVDNAEILAQRLRQAIEALSVPVTSTDRANVTVSIGVAGLQPGETLDQLMSRADRCLYDAKEQGRNQVVLAQESQEI